MLAKNPDSQAQPPPNLSKISGGWVWTCILEAHQPDLGLVVGSCRGSGEGVLGKKADSWAPASDILI